MAIGPVTPELQVDYAALLIERGVAEKRRVDLLDALHLLLEAREATRDDPAAVYDLALVLDALGLKYAATREWEAYLELDATSRWASTARERIAGRDLTVADETWTELRIQVLTEIAAGRFENALHGVGLRSATARKDVSERGLGEWATALAEGRVEDATLLLKLTEVVAEVSREQDGDFLLQDSLAAVERAIAGSAPATEAVVRGYRALSSGIALRRADACHRAEPLLAQSSLELGNVGDPMAMLAELNLAICTYESDKEAAAHLLNELAGQAERRRYPWLRAQVEWMIGLVLASQGSPWDAGRHYDAALELFTASNDTTGVAGALTLAADTYSALGLRDRAWEALLDALVMLGEAGDSVGLDRALDLAVLRAAGEGRLSTALAFQEEQVVHRGRVPAEQTSLVTFLTLRSGLLRQAGRHDEALAVIEEAQTHCDTVPDADSRARARADLDVEEALTLADYAPDRALERLATALATYERSGYRARRAELLQARAAAHRAVGDLLSAEHDLLAALEEDERARESERAEVRIAALEAAQHRFDAAISYYLDDRRDSARALDIAVRSKARELRSFTRRTNEPRTVADWQMEIPAGVAVVEYAVLPDRLAIWALTQEAMEHATVEISATRLRDRVRLFLRSASSSGSSAVEESAQLYEFLIRPVQQALAGSTAVVFVPDRFLATVPFGALHDGITGHPLVRSHRVFKTPSVHLLAGSFDPARRRERPVLLAVGNPFFDRGRHPDLDPLPGAEAEVADIAPLYPFAQTLVGSEATARRFVEEMSGATVLQLAAHARALPDGATELVFAADEPLNRSGPLALDSLGPGLFTGLELAFLSACSGATAPTGDREGLRGAARTFIAAGVPAVVASLWPVDDRASRRLARSFHLRFLETGDAGDALRTTQLDLLAAGEPIAAWAAYEVFVSAWPEAAKGE